MCFGGGGGGSRPSQPTINVTPQAPIVKTPEPPKPPTQTFKPLQNQQYQPGIQPAGTAQRLKDGYDPQRDRRRRSLSIGLSLPSNPGGPSKGGINL